MEKIIKSFWKLIESTMYFVIYKFFKLKIKEKTWNSFVQFIKFGIVGVANNAIFYVAYIILIRFSMYYILANIISFSISVFNAYYWNNAYVFKHECGNVWWKTFIKTYISYAGTGIVLSNLLLFFWVDVLDISTMIAPLINLLLTVPINFIINKFWAFHS